MHAAAHILIRFFIADTSRYFAMVPSLIFIRCAVADREPALLTGAIKGKDSMASLVMPQRNKNYSEAVACYRFAKGQVVNSATARIARMINLTLTERNSLVPVGV